MRKLAIYPGTFDPATNGHLDIITRSSELFDKVIVAVAKSSAKKPMFSLDERIEILKKATKNMKNVSVEGFSNLLAEFAAQKRVRVLIRGIRVVSDFEYELQMGYTNTSLNPHLETIYFMPALEHAFISASIVRNILEHNGSVAHLVPLEVNEYINTLYQQKER